MQPIPRVSGLTTTVDSNEDGDLPLYSSTSIAVDKGGKVHISYHGNHGFNDGNLNMPRMPQVYG